MADVFPILSKYQRYVWSHQDYWWMLFGGRRVTKSTACWLRGVDVCLHGGITAWYCASDELADENWQSICDFCQPWASRINRHTLAEMWFEDPEYGKGVFKRKSGFTKTAGRAGTVNLLIFDEAQLITRQLYNRALPSILTTNGKICTTLTPPETPDEYEKSMWLKNIIDSADEDGMSLDKRYARWFISSKPTEPWDVAFVFMMYDINNKLVRNPDKVMTYYDDHVFYSQAKGYHSTSHNTQWETYLKRAEESLQADLNEMGSADYNREYLLHWDLDVSKLVYDNATDGVTRHEKFDYDSGKRVFWAIDRAEGANYTVVLFCHVWKVGEITRKELGIERTIPQFAFRVFNEISTRKVQSEEKTILDALLLTQKEGYKLPEYVVYDIRARSFLNAIRDSGLRPVARNVPIEDGIRRIKMLIDDRRMEIHPRCTRMWQNMTHYYRDDKGFPVDDQNNDAADALRYAVWVSQVLAGVPMALTAESHNIRDELKDAELAVEAAKNQLVIPNRVSGGIWLNL